MGVDLTLLPLRFNHELLSLDAIELERRRNLWLPIEALPQNEIWGPLACHLACDKEGETCFGEIEESPYGKRLTYTSVADLLTLKDHPEVQDNWRNKAIWAYLAEMPPDWRIVLYWH